jgi:DNA gyrase subunit A
LASAPPTIDNSDISPISIVDEMKTSYLDYAMSVIVARALPDVRDGLKPVHRRILFACQEAASFPGAVSQVGQDRRRRDGQLPPARRQRDLRRARPPRPGLVDARDADRRPRAISARWIPIRPPQCATRARLAKVAMTLLEDLDKDTVDFTPNYDGSRMEPHVLPARFPNLLVNGAGGLPSAWRPTSRRTISAR